MSRVNRDVARMLVEHWPAIRDRAREVHAWYRTERYPRADPDVHVEVVLDQGGDAPAIPTITCRWTHWGAFNAHDEREDELPVAYLWRDDLSVQRDIRAQHARDDADREACLLADEKREREGREAYERVKLRELLAKYGPTP